MSDRKVNFPRYIWRPKLFFIIERDDIYVPSAAGLVVVVWGLVSAMALYMLVSIMIVVWVFVFRIYRWYKNQSTPGLIEHYLYTLGLRMPYGKRETETNTELQKLLKTRRLVPEGYEIEFSA